MTAEHPSLRRSLNFLLAGSVAAVVVLAMIAVGVALVRVTEHFVVTRLAHDRDTLVAALDRLEEDGAGLPLVYRQPYSGHYFQLSLPDGTQLGSRSLWDTRLELPPVEPGESWRGLRRGPDGQLLLVLLTGVRRAGGTAAVAVAEDVSGLIRLLSWALGGLALGGIALATVTVVVQRRVLARQLHPLWRLERDTGRLASGALEQLDNDGVPREVVPLVNAVNGMVETLSRRLSRSRRAVGDLAHALKTPLTAIGQMAGEPELRESPAVAARLRRHVDRARGIVDAQLRRARIAGGAPGGSTLLAPQVDDVLDTLRRIHAERQVAVDADVAPDLRFAGDREDVVELLGILLDNAFRWAATRVRVTARPTGEGRLELVVEDDGPGAASAAVEEMARRGRRFDESVPGSGLGLSIAAETVAEYGGRLDIQGKGELGGLRVSADLPMVAHDQSESSPSRSSPDSST